MAALPTQIGRYEIKSLIGRGGMGDLYLAHDPNTSRLVTIKLLNGTLDSTELRERFAREGRALAALNHPNIVNIYDSGEYDGSPFIVMEYVRGETLNEVIKRRSPITVSQKLKLLAELCAGLAHAHEAGIIHRDIKPANLMVDQQGHLKILDFGIARVAESSKTRVGLPLTQVDMMIGTPGYMSPEQIEGGEVDHRSDIFAAGAVAYELLSYDEAFSGANTRVIAGRALQSQPKPLATIVPGLDPEVDEIVMRALKSEPIKRYQDAATFERALVRLRTRLDAQGAHTAIRPAPDPGAPPTPREARAEAAYQRALAAREEGATEAARRFAVEALAENPSHGRARAFLASLEPRRRVPATVKSPGTVPSRTVADTSDTRSTTTSSAPTVIVTPPSAPPGSDTRALPRPGASAAAEKRLAARSSDVAWQNPGLLWNRYQKPIVIAAAVILAVVIAVPVIWMIGFRPSGPLLTIDRPTGGTLIGPGINCGARGNACSTTLADGEAIELRAEPEEGFTFVHYSGDCAPGGRMLMAGARRCGATFEPFQPPPLPTQTLIISPVPVGGTLEGVDIKCGTNGAVCSADYPDGQLASLKPIEDEGYSFEGFSGDCSKIGGQTEMAGPRTCSATFSKKVLSPPPAPTPRPDRTGPTSTVTVARGPSSETGPKPPTVNPPPTQGPDPETPKVQTPPAVTPPGPVQTPETDEQYAKRTIQELLKDYCKAYEALDPSAVQRLYPTVDIEQLRRQFSQYKSVDCTFVGEPTYPKLEARAGTALVKAEVKRVFTHTALKAKPETQELIAELTLVRREPRSPWVIEKAEYRLKPK